MFKSTTKYENKGSFARGKDLLNLLRQGPRLIAILKDIASIENLI